jgi:multiple sugar transport system substrate-binding protein
VKRLVVVITACILFAFGQAFACSFENTVPVTMLSNAFAAWTVVTDKMAECGNFTAEQDEKFREKQAPGMAANPSAYTIGGVANGSILPLLNDGLIRPLDDLVAKYGQALSPNQLIKVDGKTMAISMMVNAQHFMYRTDIFEQLGLEVPTTYADVLAVAEVIKQAGVVDYPYGAAFKSGGDLGLEFLNIYLGMGGTLVNEDNTPAVNNEKGIATLEILKALTAYMDPEFLSSDSPFVAKQIQDGSIAMANLWATDTANFNNPEESQVVDLIAFAAAPAAVEGGPPATTLWWDGMTIAKNVTDEEADAAFRLIMEGISYENLSAHPEAAIWLSSTPIESPAAIGVLASVEGGAPSYPASNPNGLMTFTALGDNIAKFLTGEKTAEETLADVETAYLTAAKEAGYVQ